MKVRIDVSAADPVWRQIADQIRAHLVSGRLRPGARLATVRELAIDLGVNHNTVATAYTRLAEEGFLRLVRGVGAEVVERAVPKAQAGEPERFARRLSALVAEARSLGVPPLSLQAALVREAEGLLS
ncbi:MAG TPA: GntR family transcriptional regulator [Myxococcales bacterium]|jgi:GntR family transcriptional regulator|nr:GntR family transcriptional regulator [Myxococcales bacterium]